MPTYNVQGWQWSGTGSPMTLVPVTITDDDAAMSPYFTNDFGETLTIGGTTYTNPRGGTYQLSFTDSDGDTHTEDFLLFNTGSGFVFVPQPGSDFDTGSTVDSLGGWVDWFTGLTWTDVVCFTRGVRIQTPDGLRLVEDLKQGDLVTTKSNGNQAIAWIGSSKTVMSEISVENAAKLRPIRIGQGMLGAGMPARDLRVSQQHRVLVTSKICQRMFDRDSVLVAAKRLLEMPGIEIDLDCVDVEYFHILFDQHEIVFSEGAASESLYTGPEALKAVSETDRAEILALFPALSDASGKPEPAALIPPNKQQRQLIKRHLKNQKPLVDASLFPQATEEAADETRANVLRLVHG